MTYQLLVYLYSSHAVPRAWSARPGPANWFTANAAGPGMKEIAARSALGDGDLAIAKLPNYSIFG